MKKIINITTVTGGPLVNGPY